MQKKLLSMFYTGVIAVLYGVIMVPASRAEVNVNINIPLPGLVIPAAPSLVVVPGTYVYYPPDVDADIFFYHGYWYRPFRGGWYVANDYNGPWRVSRRIPLAVRNVPPGHRHLPPEYEPMPYGQVKKNWRTWEDERHWEHARYKEEKKWAKEERKRDKKERKWEEKQERKEKKHKGKEQESW